LARSRKNYQFINIFEFQVKENKHFEKLQFCSFLSVCTKWKNREEKERRKIKGSGTGAKVEFMIY